MPSRGSHFAGTRTKSFEIRVSFEMRAHRTQSNVVPRSIGPMQRSVSHAAVLGKPQIKSGRTERKRICWPVFLFLIALVAPWVIPIGPLRLSVYRIVLLVM